MNPYEVLGVPKDADDKKIKKAYKELAKQLHPDRNPGDAKTEERFKEVKNAYEQIKNKAAREQYEQEELQRQYAGGAFHSDQGFGNGAQGFHFTQGDFDEDILNDLFSQFGMGGGFAGRSRAGGPRRQAPRNETATVNLDFWDAIVGGSNTINLPDGTRLQVNIPPGIKEGQKIRLKGQASKLNPLSTGDLLLKVAIKEAHDAWREGDDVVVEHELPVDTAVAGGDEVVATPLGTFHLKIPAYTNTGKKFRLKGKGPKGADLYVKMILVLPQERKREIQERFGGTAA